MNAEIEKIKLEMQELHQRMKEIQSGCNHKYIQDYTYLTDYEMRQVYKCSECDASKDEFVCDAPRL